MEVVKYHYFCLCSAILIELRLVTDRQTQGQAIANTTGYD